MYVCICKKVTDTQIREEVQAGACSLREVSKQLGVSTCCGKCVSCAKQVICETLKDIQEPGFFPAFSQVV